MRDRYGAKPALLDDALPLPDGRGVAHGPAARGEHRARGHQALAVLGGTQSLHTNSMDETLALPTEEAVRIALRTQQVIAYETGVANTVDPLGGSYYLEDADQQLEAQAYEYFERIDSSAAWSRRSSRASSRKIADAAYATSGRSSAASGSSSASTLRRGRDASRSPGRSTPSSRGSRSSGAPQGLLRDSALVQSRLGELKGGIRPHRPESDAGDPRRSPATT